LELEYVTKVWGRHVEVKRTAASLERRYNKMESINGHRIVLLKQEETTCLLQPEQSISGQSENNS
jgi:hypothetical protein